MLGLTVAALVLAGVLVVRIALNVSDRLPAEIGGPGPWGLRSRLVRPAEITSAEKRWQRELEAAGKSHKPWERLTDQVENMAEAFGLDPVDPPPKFSRQYLDERLAALENTQGATK